MSPAQVQASLVHERLTWIAEMVAGIQRLDLTDMAVFLSDPRNPAAAESFLRRAIEALLDLGRHIAAKGYGLAATEYKAVPDALYGVGVLTADEAATLRQIAGYRNRLVHFYDEVGPEELYDVCAHHVGDIVRVAAAYERWVREHPELVTTAL
jgi:uncharacterized protein YutE (UPF0331/DUF86 family)